MSASVGSGIAVGVASMNYTVFEHEVPAEFNPDTKNGSKPILGQNVSKIEAVNVHAFKDDVIIAIDAGWDNMYEYGINEWKEGIKMLHQFPRGFGPHNFAFSNKR